MNTPTLVVMAAGIGSRYGGLKQVDPVGPHGENIIDYSIFDAIRAGFKRAVFIIRRDIQDIFREKIGKFVESRIETLYVFQEIDKIPARFNLPRERTKPWGTGHAVLCAKDAIHGPAAVINADDFYGASSFKTLYDALRDIKDESAQYRYCMIGYLLANTLTEHGHVARGVCSVDVDGYLTDIVERTKVQRFGDAVKFTEDGEHWVDQPADSIVSMNMWGFTQSYFTELEKRFEGFLEQNITNPKAEFYVPLVVDNLIKDGKARVQVLPTNEKWFGVTYKEDREMVKKEIRKLIDQKLYPEKLWS